MAHVHLSFHSFSLTIETVKYIFPLQPMPPKTKIQDVNTHVQISLIRIKTKTKL